MNGKDVDHVSDQVLGSGDPMLSADDGRSSLFFDPLLETTSLALRTVVANVVSNYDRLMPARRRVRRDKDQLALERIIAAIYANLAAVLVSGHQPPKVAVKLGKAATGPTRYDAEGFGQLGKVLEAFANAGLLALNKSRKIGIASSIEPNAQLVELVRTLKLDWSRFRQADHGESIVLSVPTRDSIGRSRPGTLIDYPETDETRQLRDEMAVINQALRDADIGFVADGIEQPKTYERRLRRIFNMAAVPDEVTPISFKAGGRLYGGWWQSLKRSRRHGVRIDGAAIVDLDFSAMYLNLAYLHVGLKPPHGDLYSGILPDHESHIHRDGIKQVVSAMLSRTGVMTRLPSEAKLDLPRTANAASMRAAIIRRHPALAQAFECGLALSLTRTESDILVAVLLKLIAAGVTALPMHDGLMVHPRHADLAETVMGDIAESMVGVRLPIKRKAMSDPSTH